MIISKRNVNSKVKKKKEKTYKRHWEQYGMDTFFPSTVITTTTTGKNEKREKIIINCLSSDVIRCIWMLLIMHNGISLTLGYFHHSVVDRVGFFPRSISSKWEKSLFLHLIYDFDRFDCHNWGKSLFFVRPHMHKTPFECVYFVDFSGRFTHN